MLDIVDDVRVLMPIFDQVADFLHGEPGGAATHDLFLQRVWFVTKQPIGRDLGGRKRTGSRRRRKGGGAILRDVGNPPRLGVYDLEAIQGCPDAGLHVRLQLRRESNEVNVEMDGFGSPYVIAERHEAQGWAATRLRKNTRRYQEQE